MWARLSGRGAHPSAENRLPEVPRKVWWQLLGMGS